MPTKLPYDELDDLRPIDLAADSKKWDRRRRVDAQASTVAFLERAATHLIEDQMRKDRIFWPGAVEAVHLLRKCIALINAEELMNQRAGRIAASWLPKCVLARQSRDAISDA